VNFIFIICRFSNALESISGQHQVELQQACQYKTEEIRSLMKSDVAAAELTVSDLRSQLLDANQVIDSFSNFLFSAFILYFRYQTLKYLWRSTPGFPIKTLTNY